MGISFVAPAAAISAGVALAMMRSTSSETNWLAMTAQLGWSPAPFWTVMFTRSPSSSLSLSQKPWVARSSAGCCTSWQTPTLKTLSLCAAAGAAEEAGALWPQAASVKSRHSAQIRERIFFIFISSKLISSPGKKESRTVICAAPVSFLCDQRRSLCSTNNPYFLLK